jgi:hypothetical protein
MPASDDFLKNLLRVMQKVSLAIAAVSIAIFGAAFLPRNSAEQHALDEIPKLRRMLQVLGDYDSETIVNQNLSRNNHSPAERHLAASLKVGDEYVGSGINLSWHDVLCGSDGTVKMQSDWSKTKFRDANALKDLIKIWDEVTLTKTFWVLQDRPDKMILYFGEETGPAIDVEPIYLTSNSIGPNLVHVSSALSKTKKGDDDIIFFDYECQPDLKSSERSARNSKVGGTKVLRT